jgi:anti-sigma28 factor (negative regulator of flagellin synthesis)
LIFMAVASPCSPHLRPPAYDVAAARRQRLDDLRRAIRDGRYRVNAMVLAERMIRADAL